METIGELQLAIGALAERVERLEQDRRYAEAEGLKTLTGTIQGLEGEWTVTPPPEWKTWEADLEGLTVKDIEVIAEAYGIS
jgi:hypothetical protein